MGEELVNMKDRRILVTGAGSGIGAAVARRLARLGARVACLDRDGAAATALAETLQADAIAIAADVSDEVAVARALAEADENLGGIDGVVNSAGIVSVKPVTELSLDAWRAVIDVNLTGTFIVSQAAIPYLRKATNPAIVNISSAQALSPVAGTSAYAASKGGVLSLTRALAAELGPQIRVNCICPGLIDTPMNESLKTKADDGPPVPLDRYALRRWGDPDEVAATIVFLLSSAASYMTGATMAVDGGRTYH